MSEVSDMLKEYASVITGMSYEELVNFSELDSDRNVLGKELSYSNLEDKRILARGNPLFTHNDRMIGRKEINKRWESIWKEEN
ncbi:MAG: hypothetical protein IJV35_02655 [Neisseriaceae bacterium]|nr:hypothetical protein [Neisseriaceae bacterium]